MSTHTIKEIRAEFKAQGKFHTPPELSRFLRGLIPGEPRDAYDPTCGAGALLAEFDDATPKYGQDIDEAALIDAQAVPNMHISLGDVLTDPAFIERRFHAIVANPPFSIAWDPHVDERFEAMPCVPSKGRADYVFIGHIIHMLADDGTAAVLAFPGILYRGAREGKIRQWMVEQNLVDQIIQIPGDTFTDTAISTVALVLRKNRAVDEPVTFVDRELGLDREVTRDEIRDNDFTLSVGRYVQATTAPQPPVDPDALQRDIVTHLCHHVTNSLRTQRMVCDNFGGNYARIWRQVRDVVDRERPDTHLSPVDPMGTGNLLEEL